jgi:hypothetical protein
MTKHKQAGLSMSGFLLWCVILAVLALLGFKLGPPYMEDITIKKHLKTVANEVPSGNRKDVENAFSNRAQIDRIEIITPKQIEIAKEGNGVVLSVTYTNCVSVVYNIRACMDFNPSSR